MKVCYHPLCHYLNTCNEAILLQNDYMMMFDFVPFQAHSPVCIYVLMHDVILSTIAKMSFEGINATDQAMFKSTFLQNWELAAKTSEDFVLKRLTHSECDFSTRNYDPKKPLFILPEIQKSSMICLLPTCEKRGEFRCTNCKMAFYCCKDHQRENWKSHKIMCSQFKEFENDVLFKNVLEKLQ